MNVSSCRSSNGIDNKFADVSQAASLAAAELEFRQAGPLILKRLERQIADSESYADLDGPGLLRDTLRYQPAISLLRSIATPFDKSDGLPIEYSAGNTEFGCEAALAEAILDIENRPNRAEAIADGRGSHTGRKCPSGCSAHVR